MMKYLQRANRYVTRTLFSILTCLTLFLGILGLISVPAHAEEWAFMDGAEPTTNPYPDRFSDEQIDLVKNGQYALKYEIIRNGTIITRPRFESAFTFEPGDEIRFYLVITPDAYGSIGHNLGFYAIYPHEIQDDQGNVRIGALSNPGDRQAYYLPLAPEVYLNGKPFKPYWNGGMWSPDTTYEPHALDITQPVMFPNRVKYNQYFEYRFVIPPGATFVGRFWKMSSAGSSWAGTTTFFWGGELRVSARFHYVDDAAYRALNHIEDPLNIPERSAQGGIFSVAPFTRLDLPSIIEGDGTPESDLEANLGNLNSATPAVAAPYYPVNTEIPFFRAGLTPPEDFTIWDHENWMNTLPTAHNLVEDSAVYRPSFENIYQRKIPGWIFIGTDIDRPNRENPQADNSRLVAAYDPTKPIASRDRLPQDRPATLADVADAGILNERHYYLTYRKIPQPVTIHKVDPQGNPLPGAHFDLYLRKDSGEEMLLKKDFVTDDQGLIGNWSPERIHSDFMWGFVREDFVAEKGYLYWAVNDNLTMLHLVPGTYVLRETQAPVGFTPAEDIVFTIDLQTAEELQRLDLFVVNAPLSTLPPAPDTPDNSDPSVPVSSTPSETPNTNQHTHALPRSGDSALPVSGVFTCLGTLMFLISLHIKQKRA